MITDPHGLRFGALPFGTVHVCVDMQRLFAEDTPWKTPWMARVLPNAVALASAHGSDTLFTRFIPASHPGDGDGVWRRYWRRWAEMTLEELEPGMVDLVSELARLSPPGEVVDKVSAYSPWITPDFEATLQRRRAEALVVTGGETDVCVLATVLGGVDRGYRMIVVTDALCSSSDETHDAMITLFSQRFSQQIETATTADVLSGWR